MAIQPRWSRLVSTRITKAIRQSPWSETYIASESGIALNTLRRRLGGTTPWTLTEVEAVAKVLSIDPDTFLERTPRGQSEAS